MFNATKNYFSFGKAASSTSTSETEPQPQTNTTETNSNKSSSWSAGLSTFVSNVATTTLQKIKTVVEEEQQTLKSFLSETEEKRKKEEESQMQKEIQTLHPPWENLPTTDTKLEQEVRAQIKGLLKSTRNFLNAPPGDDPNFTFDFNLPHNVALAQVCLKADPTLAELRWFLVPKYIKEPIFWRNYFYRVWIIKEAYGLNPKQQEPSETLNESPTQQNTVETINNNENNNKQSPSNASAESTNTSTTNPPIQKRLPSIEPDQEIDVVSTNDVEFVSDGFSDDRLDLASFQSELDQLGVDSISTSLNNNILGTELWMTEEKKEADESDDEASLEIDEAWEAELRRELEEDDDI